MTQSKTKLYHTAADEPPFECMTGDLSERGLLVVVDKRTHELLVAEGAEADTFSVIVNPKGAQVQGVSPRPGTRMLDLRPSSADPMQQAAESIERLRRGVAGDARNLAESVSEQLALHDTRSHSDQKNPDCELLENLLVVCSDLKQVIDSYPYGDLLHAPSGQIIQESATYETAVRVMNEAEVRLQGSPFTRPLQRENSPKSKPRAKRPGTRMLDLGASSSDPMQQAGESTERLRREPPQEES